MDDRGHTRRGSCILQKRWRHTRENTWNKSFVPGNFLTSLLLRVLSFFQRINKLNSRLLDAMEKYRLRY